MKTKNLFLTTLLVVFGAINENVAQNYSAPTGSARNGGNFNTFLGITAGSDNISPNYFSNVAIGHEAGFYLNGSRNCFIGASAGTKTTTGINNVFLGASAGFNNVSGSNNIFIGRNSGTSNVTGNGNISLGDESNTLSAIGSYNTFLGTSTGAQNISGEFNTTVGASSGYYIGTGKNNSFFGYKSGEGVTNGNYNLLLGYVTVSNPSISNSIILADGEGNQRFYVHNNGFAGIGLGNNVIPNNRLEIMHGTTGNSGLRFSNLKSSFIPTTTASKFLTVDANGDVILQNVSASGGSGSTTITAGQNIVVTNTGSDFVISSPTSNALVNNTNTMTSTVNGVIANAPIVNIVINSIASGQLTTTVNGVASNPVALPVLNEVDGDVTNELQNLGLSGNVLSISNGNSVTLPSYVDTDTDAQTLSITGNQLTISNGNTVNLPTFTEVDGDVTNELQTLTQSPIQTTGTAIKLSNGGGTVYVDGSETKIQAGTNVTVTGNGTIATPYVINSTASGSGTNTSIYTHSLPIIPANFGNRVVTLNNNNLVFNTAGLNNTRNKVYIGSNLTGNPFPTTTGNYRLYVEGGILTEKVKVALRTSANWADYVFANDYKLMPLNEVETFVKTNKHLPGISSAEDLAKEGLDLGEMQAKQMEKIEELTLYIIEMNKKLESQANEYTRFKIKIEII